AGHLPKQGQYGNAIWAGDPADSRRVLLGGVDLFQSTDGGGRVTPFLPAVPHHDLHLLVTDPRAAGKSIYVGSDGGLHRLKDLATWERLNDGLAITQFYGVAVNETSGTIIGGTQDNGTLRLYEGDRPDQFGMLDGGDGGYCAADPKDPHFLYLENEHLQLQR